MANIFDIIGSGVTKVLGNPYVQGLGIATMGGFPAMAPVVGGLLKGGREAAAENLEMKRNRMDAIKEFEQLATSTPQRRIPSMPLLGIDGSVDDIIPGYETRSAENQVPALSTSAGQQQALGLLSRIAPNAVANQIAGSYAGGRTPAKIEQVRQIMEWRRQGRNAEADLLEQSMMTSANPYATMVDRLRMEQLMDQIARDRREDTRGETERGQSDVLDASQVRTSIDQLIELGGLNEQLAGTFQATGLPAPEARETLGSLGGAVGNVLGIENTLQEDAAAKGLFNKYKSQLQFDLLKDAEVGSRAANIANQFFKGTVGEIGSAANSIVIADQIEGRLRYADAMNINIPPEQRAKAEAAIEYYRDLGKQGTGQGGEDRGYDKVWDPNNGVSE